jgi:hypothetical protein
MVVRAEAPSTRWLKLTAVLGLVSILSGCGTYEAVRGIVSSEPAKPARQAAQRGQPQETRWVLVRNIRYGGTSAEPEFVWVEEDKVPASLTTVMFGKNSALAPRDEVAKYWPPPGNGKLSHLQGGPPPVSPQTASLRPTVPRSAAVRPGQALTDEAPARPEITPKGYIVYIQNRTIVVDLTSLDGVKKGSALSLRRERLPLTHPITGDYLGELDEEIGTARVVELRERFTVAEIENLRPGIELRVKDRVVVRP